MNTHKPAYIKPFLVVKNAAEAVSFYKSSFAAVEINRFELPDDAGSFVLAIEGQEFYVGDEEPKFGNFAPDAARQSPVRIVLQTANADWLFKNALEYGAEEICPMTTGDEWRIGKLKDPFGHIWEIGFTF